MHPLLLTSLDDSLRFGSPGWLWALLVIVPLLWFFIDAARRRGVLLAKIVAPRLQQQLTGQVSPLKRNLRTGLLLGAIALLIVGLAKPRFGYKELEIKSKGRDVIIAIDTSRSMLSTDTAPTRLARAKLIAQDLLGFLKGDRVGLIAFAGDAFLQAPLTLDKGAVLTSLEDLDSNTIPKGGTDIASAIRMAIAAFGKGEGMSRALILMTDGEDLEASGLEAAKEAAAAGVRIFTIGFGSPSGSLIPLRTEEGRNDFVRDQTGKPVTSKLDASRLTEIAKETGGFYQPFGQNAAKLIYDKGIVPMEEQESGVLSSRKPIERYAWPVSCALLLLAIWSLLGEGRRLQRIPTVLILLLLPALSVRQAEASGLSDYKQGNYPGALKDFESRLQKGAAAAEIKFDAGAAAYKAGDFKKASGYFSEAMTSAKQKIREDATYNLANALVRTGEAAQESEAKLADWKNALQHYETVLKTNSKNVPAKENRDIVRKLIEDLKKQQEQKKNDKDKKQDQKDQKDNKNKDQKDKKDQNKDQQQSDKSQGGGEGKKDQKDQKDSKDQKDQQKDKNGKGDQDKEKPQDSKDQKDQGKNQNQDQNKGQQGSPSPTPSPSPSPDQGKGDGSKNEKKDQKDSKDSKDQGDQQNQKGEQQKQQSPQQQPANQGKPTPAPSASPKKEGALGGGEQGDKKEQPPAEAAEAEEGKDGKMTPGQARALLRSLQDEEAHQQGTQQQRRGVEQPLRDW